MRSPTDLPRRRRMRSPRGRLGLILALVVIFFLIVSLRGIAGFYTDYLWFQELHLTSVWRGVLGAKVFLGVIFTVVFFVLMWVNLTIADRIAPAFRPMGPEEELVERYHQVVGARAGLVRVAVAVLFALIAGPSVASRWNSWILFRNHVSFGIKNVFHHIGGEQAHGEQPEQERRKVPAGADALVTGERVAVHPVREDEVTPDGEEVADLGELPQRVGPEPGAGEHGERHEPDDVLGGPDLVRDQERGQHEEAQLRQPGAAGRGERQHRDGREGEGEQGRRHPRCLLNT